MSNNKGFTLLEVLVAFVIAALALGVLFQGMATTLDSVRVSGQYQEAVSRARSHLAAVGHGEPLRTENQEGDDGSGFHWRLHIAPLATASVSRGDPTETARGPRAVLYEVVVVISWRSGIKTREVRLQSRRTGVAAPASP